MRRLLVVLTAAVALIMDVRAGIAGNPEQVEISVGERQLQAVLFRPEGNGPFPAVVGLHNCTGLINRAGAMGARYSDWGERLSKSGFAVLLPDSNKSRGLGSQCGTRSRSVRVDRELVEDANTARLWLQRQPWVVADRVSLLGWSTGAIAVLWTVRARVPVAQGPDFRSAVAFYPGCRRLGVSAWSARVPTLILIGRADEMASAATCQQMVAGARGRSARVEIRVYPNAHHDFDHPNRPLQVRTGLAFSIDGSGRVQSGTDPAARADAVKRVPAWFTR
jgi:dienelactone hydrolase